MTLDPIIDLLRASLEEQVPVRIFIRGAELGGTVTRIGEAAVELVNKGARGAVRLMNIDAVVLGAHGEAAPIKP
jgi:hypothetical protein